MRRGGGAVVGEEVENDLLVLPGVTQGVLKAEDGGKDPTQKTPKYLLQLGR